MKLSRSAGSTSAPHLVILSTSFVHAPLLSRCWMMMRDSWHSVHAVVTFACTGPAGSSGDCARSSGRLHTTSNTAATFVIPKSESDEESAVLVAFEKKQGPR